MRISWITLAAMLAGILCCLEAQTDSQTLYFLSVSLSREYHGARLYKVDPAQGPAPQLVREVTKNWESVLADYDRLRFVIAPNLLAQHTFSVVDMAAPNEEHTVSIDYCGLGDSNCPGATAQRSQGIYLLADEGGLLAAMPLRPMSEPNQQQPPSLMAVRIDDAQPQTVNLPLTELAHIRFSGRVGGALSEEIDRVPEVSGESLHILISDPVGFATGIPRPPYIQTGPDLIANTFWLTARTDSITVLKPYRPLESNVIDVFDQARGTWRRVDLPFTTRRIRAFGSWIAAIASQPRLPEPPGAKRKTYSVEELSRMPASPGKEKRMTEDLDNGPDVVIQSLPDGKTARKIRKPGYHPIRESADEFFSSRTSTFPATCWLLTGAQGSSSRFTQVRGTVKWCL